MPHSYQELAEMIRSEPSPGVLKNVVDDLRGAGGEVGNLAEEMRAVITNPRAPVYSLEDVISGLLFALHETDGQNIPEVAPGEAEELARRFVQYRQTGARRRRKTLRRKIRKSHRRSRRV